MPTITDALKDLYLACGGDPANLADNHTVEDYIRDLTSVLAGGGGGSDVYIVNFVDYYDEQDVEHYSIDDTFENIVSAYKSGKIVLAKLNNPLVDYESRDNQLYLVKFNGELVNDEPVINAVKIDMSSFGISNNELSAFYSVLTLDSNDNLTLDTQNWRSN